MDNELPWNPPEPQQRPQPPKIGSQVPDVTLFSPTNKPNTISHAISSKSNFLQRAIASEKILNIPKQTSAPKSHAFNNDLISKPSVPDLSLFDPQVLHPTNKLNGPAKPSSVPNKIFTKANQTSRENIFGSIGKPSVPDVTILDQELKKHVSDDRTSGESYKQQLLISHEQFLKQIRTDPSPELQTVNGKKKSPLFNFQPIKYQENPLTKYAPKPSPVSYENDGNSSSILIETDDVNVPSPAMNLDKSDEMTFKKVAEMLCEIQKYVIPGKPADSTDQSEKTPTSSSQKCAVLKRLATTYLTTEEIELYDIERELREIESSS